MCTCVGRESVVDWWVDDGAGCRKVSSARAHRAAYSPVLRHQTRTVSGRRQTFVVGDVLLVDLDNQKLLVF